MGQPEIGAGSSPDDVSAIGYARSPGILFCVTVGEVMRFGPVSSTFLEVTGLDEHQVVGRPVHEVIPEPSRTLVLAKYAEAVRTRSAVRWEETSTYPTGTMDGEVTVTPIFDAAGSCTHLVGIVHDVTKRRRAEEALRQSEQKYRVLIETTGTGYTILDAEGRVKDANQEYVRLSGHQHLEEILGRNVVEWTAKHDHERSAAEVTRCLEEGVLRQVEIDYVDAEGRVTPIEVDASVLKIDSAVSIVGLCKEITERRRMEEALRASEARLAQLVHSSPVVLYACSAEPPYAATFVGENVKEQFGYEARGFVDDPRFWAARIHPDDAPRVLSELKTLFEHDTHDHEYRFRSADGSYRWVHDALKLVRDASGRPVQIIGYWADVSARKHAEESLRIAEQRKDEFLAILSHELRNPLAPIRNAVYLLDRLASLDGRNRTALDVIGRQVTQLARLVDDLLDVTRISRGKIRLQREPLDLGPLVRRAIADHHALLASFELVVRLPEEPLWVDGDSVRLAQVVGNLLTNGAKFTPKGGTITVELARTDKSARLEVADTGMGMDRDILERVFEPFAQAERTLERSRGGLGLGLALVKGLVEQHGGEVRAHTDGPGRGARFTIELPLREQRNRETAAQRDAAVPHGAGVGHAARSVLVIEDNEDAATTLQYALELEGLRVTVAHTGVEGLAVAREQHPDVVVCDIGLPELDGYEVASALRRDRAADSTYLIALTGYAQPEDKQRALRAGFDAHLAKPPDLDELHALLATAHAESQRS